MTSPTGPQQTWRQLLATARPAFTAPGFAVFETLLAGWVLTPGRRTITAMICAADPESRRAHDAYHRFVRCGRWSVDTLWKTLVTHLVAQFFPTGSIPLDVDDTLYKKTGPNINGTGIFRDAVASTKNRVVYALGLNLVVVTMRVTPPWGGCPIALPVGVRLHPKNGPTTIDLAEQILRQLAEWLPDRTFTLCGDGAYATLLGHALPHTTVTSRLRRDAALYEAAPPRTGKRGRPRTKGDRLPTPTNIAANLTTKDFTYAQINNRGRTATVLTWTRQVLWYGVDKKRMLTLVIVRDPNGICPDDFFITDQPQPDGADIAAQYAGRWAIEICFRDTKQHLGAEDPQTRTGDGPARAAALSLWLYSTTWTWHITVNGTNPTGTPRPWYRRKTTPSFLDALASLRRTLWTTRITATPPHDPHHPKILDGILDILANAA